MKIIIATEKPFAKAAVDGIRNIIEEAGFEFHLLEKYSDINTFQNAVADADGLIVRSDKVTKDIIDAAPRLKIVVRAGAGYDNLDLAACSGRGIVAMNTPGQNANAVAELAIGLMLYAARNTFGPGTGSELKGKKLGIHAYGNVGRLVARLGKSFGMDVHAFDPFVPHSAIIEDGVQVCASVEELYATCRYISLHIPATAQTRKSIGRSLLNIMPEGACIINTARKEIINEDDLAAILRERPDMKYMTDIAPDNHAALQQTAGTRYFATPKKIGAETAEANINAGLAAARQTVRFFATGETTFKLN
ncbi:MAG: 3-phosphoglycerate dehydrogenase [Prevotellaceae bacterium]|jgi:D-3-phosphoglycerate dehydrogenase|nr:3-phosphoglycerate dehydrogenase [Prevotellaceae bacterium]